MSAGVTTPQGRCVAGALANKPRFRERSNASRSANKSHHSQMGLIEADGANTFGRAGAHATGLGTTSAVGLIDSGVVEKIRGILDTSFNPTGAQPGTNVVSAGGADSKAGGIAIDSQGRIILVGYANDGSEDAINNFAAARFTKDGALDTDFGAGGITSISIVDGNNSRAYGVAINLLDDSIILAGYANDGSVDKFAVAKLMEDGTLDASFGDNGVKAFPIVADKDSGAYGVAIDSQSRIVLGGYTDGESAYQFAAARLTVSGDLDADFNSAGVRSFRVITAEKCQAYCVALNIDDSVILGGYTAQSGKVDCFAVAKLTPIGNLDSDFNTTGVNYFDIAASSADSYAYGVAIDSSGKIVLGGELYYGQIDLPYYRFAAARLSSDGALDTSFNSTGKVVTSIDGLDTGSDSCGAHGVAIGSNDSIVLGGYSNDGSGFRSAVARFKSTGDLDETFNSAGDQPGTAVTTINDSDLQNQSSCVVVDSNDKIVCAGYSNYHGDASQFAVARFKKTS